MNSLWTKLGYVFLLVAIGAAIYIYTTVYGGFDLKCIVSTVDGNKYCVRERAKLQDAADLLAQVTAKCKQLVDYMATKYPDDESVQRLVKNFHPTKIMETLPTSSYTAYSENKGQKIAFCLNVEKKGNKENLIDLHTLTFVALHELAHTMTKSIGHKEEFWDNFRVLLENAKTAGIHEPRDYKKSPTEYCSMKLTDNPYFEK